MRIAIFGGSGRSGRVVVGRALRLGHRVVVLSRDPAGIPAREGLTVVRGDVRDPAAVARTVEGADAVVSTLGRQRRGGATCTDGMRTILSAMAGSGVRRLVVLTNYGVGESRRRDLYVGVSWLMERAVLRDKEGMEALVRASGATWTLVRAPVLTDGPATGRYRVGAGLRPALTSRVSRADLAAFLLAELEDGAYPRQGVVITS